MTFSFAKFDRNAPQMIADLIHDFGLKDFQAAALPGQTAAESRWMTDIIEDGALSKGQAGGTGWFQDTGLKKGQRRYEFEKWLRRKNYFGLGSLSKAADSYIGNYSYLFRELIGPEKAALAALRRTTTPAEAAEVVARKFERPANPAASLALRIKGTERALELYRKNPPPPTVWPTDHPATVESHTMPVTTAAVTAGIHSARRAIPFFKSIVTMGAGSGLGASLVAIFSAYQPGVPFMDQLPILGPLFVAAAGTGSALVSRIGSDAQPLTMSQGKADEITAERTVVVDAPATIPLAPEAWAEPQPDAVPESVEDKIADLVHTLLSLPIGVRAAVPALVTVADTIQAATGEASVTNGL